MTPIEYISEYVELNICRKKCTIVVFNSRHMSHEYVGKYAMCVAYFETCFYVAIFGYLKLIFKRKVSEMLIDFPHSNFPHSVCRGNLTIASCNEKQYTVQNMKFSTTDFFCKYDQIHRKLEI